MPGGKMFPRPPRSQAAEEPLGREPEGEGGEEGEIVREEQESHQHKEDAAHATHPREEAPEPVEESQEATEEERTQQEGDRKSGRVGGEEKDSLARRLRSARHEQDRTEDGADRSEEHTSELQSRLHLVSRLLL